jgi:S-adenosylmethionine:tRNA ribosyltransferase-isomerase
MKLSDFRYDLPKKLIAARPAEPRGNSRLLVMDRQTGEIEHHSFPELPLLLKAGDVLVRNNSKVIPARLFGQKTSGGLLEVLLVKKLAFDDSSETWEVLTKPGIKPGTIINFPNSKLSTKCVQINGYTRQLVFNQTGLEFLETLDQIGKTPLPHYIEWAGEDEQELRQLYQTTYAKHIGSVAAPTAGLHFIPELDEQLRAKGVEIVDVTLHVGLGTFLPVKTDDVTQHHMHEEWCSISPKTAKIINTTKSEGRRIIAVGTTSLRTLEFMNDENGQLQSGEKQNKLYVYPPYKFQIADGLITNFHLPESTLLMLVSAFTSAPNTPFEFTNFLNSPIGQAYQTAIKEKYRFFSFGDAMLIISAADQSSPPSQNR